MKPWASWLSAIELGFGAADEADDLLDLAWQGSKKQIGEYTCLKFHENDRL